MTPFTERQELIAAFARGLMQGLLTQDAENSPVIAADHAEKTPPLARASIPDIAPPAPEEIDLFARMKDEMREGDVDMSDVASVEAALREMAAQREAAAGTPVGEGTRRVRAPDV